MSAPFRYVGYADGGSRGNPGLAAYGALIVDTDGDVVLAERSKYIGTETNNVAEYGGLIAALEAALELGITELEMRMDSKLVVEQMSGRWKVKHPAMKPLALQAKKLADQFDRVQYTWIPRANNSHADRLANEAMDEAAGLPKPRRAATVIEPEPADAAHATSTTGIAAHAGSKVTAERDRPTNLVTAHPGAPPALSLILLRHGETEQSLERRFSGSSDLPLTDKGLAQAMAAARRIADAEAISAIYCSPLQRAQQTAHAVSAATGIPVTVEPDLREVDFGEWEGMTFAEARESGGDAFGRWAAHTDLAPPGGESQQQCLDRVVATRDRLLAEHDGQRVLVVTHVTPIKSLIGEALGGLGIASRINLDLCSLSRIDYRPGQAVVKLVNEISHLGAL